MATNTSAVISPARPAQTRPLQREGAIFILTTEEQAMEDAMLRSSPEPEGSGTTLGKRTRDDNDNEQDSDNNTEQGPEDETPSSSQSFVIPTLSNITAATLRYATQKRLRAEQRGELEAFLLVSNTPLMHFAFKLCLNIFHWQDSALGRQARLFTCLLSVENKVDAFKSAAPPYQVSEELKVCFQTFLNDLTAINRFYIDQHQQLCRSSVALH